VRVRMDELAPWAEFCAVIEHYYPKAGSWRPSVGLERILRMYLIANWSNLADAACEYPLYDVPAFMFFSDST
jgi:transposase, IS5 family